MHEHRVIVCRSADAEATEATLDKLRWHMASMAGGYTETTGRGGWIDPGTGVLHTDSVHVFDFALTTRSPFAERLVDAAGDANRQLGHKAMYYRDGEGFVTIIDL